MSAVAAALPGQTLTGKVDAILPDINTGTRTIKVRIELQNKGRLGDEPWFVITGDTLFVGAVGRPDLAGREPEMAAQLHDSLHRKLLNLPAELEIYPGHQAGSACGAGLSGKPASTIGFQKRFNPMLAMSRDAFVDAVVADIPQQPENMARIIETA